MFDQDAPAEGGRRLRPLRKHPADDHPSTWLGRAVRYTREVEAVDFSGLTQFYWNPSRGEVCFISLNNRGIVGEGVVKAEDGRIVLRGKSHRPDKTIEFKTMLEVDPNGTLRDTFLRMEGSEWVQGHLQEFVVRQ